MEKLGETSKMGLGKGGGVILAFSIDLIMQGHSGFARYCRPIKVWSPIL